MHQNHIIRARCIEGVLPDYVTAYWNSPFGSQRIVNVASSTSGLYTLSVSKVGNLPIPLPPLAEQHRIIAEVERRLRIVDELEELGSDNLERADELRRSILRRAFEGCLVPQDPNDEPASVLLQRIAAERQRRAEEAMTKKKRLPVTRRRKKEDAESAGALFRLVAMRENHRNLLIA